MADPVKRKLCPVCEQPFRWWHNLNPACYFPPVHGTCLLGYLWFQTLGPRSILHEKET